MLHKLCLNGFVVAKKPSIICPFNLSNKIESQIDGMYLFWNSMPIISDILCNPIALKNILYRFKLNQSYFNYNTFKMNPPEK